MARKLNKLTRQQWDMLDEQYRSTPDVSDSSAPPGEHYKLISVLGKCGHLAHGRDEAMSMASDLLANGYIERKIAKPKPVQNTWFGLFEAKNEN